MKKIFTLISAVAMALSAMATDYTNPMNIVVDGTSAPQGNATISFTVADDGTYSLTLKNFIFNMGETTMPVGNINATGLVGTADADGWVVIAPQTVQCKVTAGDAGTSWMGPFLLPNVNATIEAVELNSYVETPALDALIALNVLGQNIVVEFGKMPQKFFFNEPMAIAMNGVVIPQPNGALAVRIIDGICNVELSNFIFNAGESSIPIGNISVNAGEADSYDNGTWTVNVESAIANLSAGDLPGVTTWIGGTVLTQVPVKVAAEWTAVNMEATINLTMPGIGDITVYYGENTVNSALSDGINALEAADEAVTGVYDLTGARVANPMAGRVYIYTLAGGKAVKKIAE